METAKEIIANKKLDEITEEDMSVYDKVFCTLVPYPEQLSTPFKAILLKDHLGLSFYYHYQANLTNDVPIVKEFKKYNIASVDTLSTKYTLFNELAFFHDFSKVYIEEKVFPYLNCKEFFINRSESLAIHRLSVLFNKLINNSATISPLDKNIFANNEGNYPLDDMVLEDCLKHIEEIEQDEIRNSFIGHLEKCLRQINPNAYFYEPIIFRFPELKLRML